MPDPILNQNPNVEQPKRKKRRGWLWWFLGVIVLIIAAVIVIYFYYYKPALNNDQAEQAEPIDQVEQEVELTYDLYFVQETFDDNDNVLSGLYKVDPLAPSSPTLLKSSEDATYWAVSKQGDYAFVDKEGDIKIKTADNQDFTIDLVSSDFMPYYEKFLTFSSDGKTLYYSTGEHVDNKIISDINAYNIATQATVTLLKREQDRKFIIPVGIVSFSGQENLLIRTLLSETEGPIFLSDFERIDPATKAVAPIVFPSDAIDFDINADGTKLAIVTVDSLDPIAASTIKIMDVTSGALETLLSNNESKMYQTPEWLDDDMIVFSEGSGEQVLEGPTTPDFEKYRILSIQVSDKSLTEVLAAKIDEVRVWDASGDTCAIITYPTDKDMQFAVLHVANKKETITKGGSDTPFRYRFVNYASGL
ncbi:hypothetical protein ACFL1U_02860 [Patescibacteria group bacterium]